MYKKFTAFICGTKWCCPPKAVLIMKLIFVLLTATFLQATAATYAQRVSLKVRDAAIKDVFEQIQSQTNYDFLYNTRDLRQAKPVNLNLENASLKQTLDACFNNQALTYTIENTTIIIEPKKELKDKSYKEALKKEIRGTIRDSIGTLPGVSVLIKGTTKGVTSDVNGKYNTGCSG